MLFNSVDFAVFLPIVFFLYWFATNHRLKLQNLLLVAASYVFYGWWDWRFLALIVISSLIDFSIGKRMGATDDPGRRKILLYVSILVNLGFLGFFKYYNFFLDSFVDAFSFFGSEFSVNRLNIVLPVGISFYTFQTLSYSIDVYRKKLEPTSDIVAFFAFVSFFPQLVAGPIERATNLLPQFYRQRTFDYQKSIDGLRQMLWGFFKKIVIADNCAPYVNEIFANYQDYSGGVLFLGAVLFAFQIYGDFSGYSDIAIGTARLFGFQLMQNFAFPYFSRDIAEFWRRWHISLSTWFRDYLYIPLGGSRGGNWMRIRNTFAIFLVSGFWHGANWTFVIWGFLNACYFLPLLLFNLNRRNLDIVAGNGWFPSLREILQMSITFFITCIAWIFFRAATVTDAFAMNARIFSPDFFAVTTRELAVLSEGFVSVLHFFYILLLIVVEWTNRRCQFGLENVPGNRWLRWGIYLLLIAMVLFSVDYHSPAEFIYFQF